MKTFLITGCSKGIGFAIAKHLHNLDYQVIGIARSKSSENFPGILYHADLSNQKETQAIFEEIKQQHHIDGIINNVARVQPKLIAELTIESFYEVMDLNLRPAIQAAKIFLPHMQENNWGRIVNITSRAMLGKIARTSYSAAKAGLTAITRSWSLEFIDSGITVNAVAPGPIATEGLNNNYPPNSPERQQLVSTIPAGRLGEPEEVAYAVAFFLDERAGFVTGQTLFVDGGASVGFVKM